MENRDQNYNQLERGVSAMIYMHQIKIMEQICMLGPNGSATLLVPISLALKMTSQDVFGWLIAN